MTKRGEKTAANEGASAHPPHAEPPAAAPEAAQPEGPLLPEKRRPFWELRPIVFSLAVAGLLLVAKIYLLEPTVFGQQLDQIGVRLLQVQLSDSSRWRGDPVRIVDISSLPPSSPASATGAIVVTNRPELTKYLDQVASAGPSAVGIDLVFDPAPGGTVSDEDYKFLDHCLHLSDPSGRPIPVRVGIYKALALGPDRWLGDPSFRCLGTSIIVPFEDEAHKTAPTGRMISQFSFKVNNELVTADSLSYSLFKIAQSEAAKRSPQPKWTQHWKLKADTFADTFLINFGLLQKLMDSRIKAEDIGCHRSDLHNRIVLIGRATPGEAPDVFTTAASDEPIPGIYIHAAAVYTLMEAPLWELSNKWIRLSIDLLLALVIIVFDRWMDHMLGSDSQYKLRTRLEIVVPALMAACVLVLGLLWVEVTGIYWTDFVVVAIVLLIHKPLEAGCHIAWEALSKSPWLLWRKT
jgi:hypothetical protein